MSWNRSTEQRRRDLTVKFRHRDKGRKRSKFRTTRQNPKYGEQW